MSRALVICGVLVLCAAGPSLASDIEDLVEAERRFAKAAATDGMRDAFLAVLGKDAVLFRPGPVSGRDWFEANRDRFTNPRRARVRRIRISGSRPDAAERARTATESRVGQQRLQR